MIRPALALTLAGLAAAFAAPAGAVTCEDMEFEGTPYTICEVSPREERLRLFLNGPDGTPFGSFRAVEEAEGELAFATNAGMYHEDRRPVGLFVQEGEEVAPLVTSDGPGNFGLLPNGLLCLSDEGAFVVESLAFDAGARECASATQSGPMLVIGGDLHPSFRESSDSLNIRNGVGTSADGSRAVFAISNRPVNFFDFARLFRDGLGLPDALYFDGRVSRLHAPSLNRSDFGTPMGPMVGVLASEAAP